MPATATPHRLKGMVAVSKDSNVKPLGYVVWFSVPDEDISLRTLKRLWAINGLPTGVLPSDPKAVNAFKRAMRSLEGKHRDEAARMVTETDVRLVLEEGKDVIYQVTRIGRDLAERVVNYHAAVRVWFNKETEDINFSKLSDGSRKEMFDIGEAINDAYEANSKTVTGPKVRGIVRNFIRDDHDEVRRDDNGHAIPGTGSWGLSGENLRGKAGGVYFVLAKYRDDLENLHECLSALYKPEGRAYCYSVPMADGASERELIRRHHVANTMDAITTALGVGRKLAKGTMDGDPRARRVRGNVLQHHWTELGKLRRRAAQYQEALREEQDDLETRLDMLDKQMRRLTSM